MLAKGQQSFDQSLNHHSLGQKDIESLNAHGMTQSIETDEGQLRLKRNVFKCDKCPLFLSRIAEDRSQFAKSSLVKDHQFIIQVNFLKVLNDCSNVFISFIQKCNLLTHSHLDRAFTLGPAIFSRLLEYFDIKGDIKQTHLSSPRSVADLGALHQSNWCVNEIIVFGAGAKLHEYDDYLDQLGITNCTIRSENICDSLSSLCLAFL